MASIMEKSTFSEIYKLVKNNRQGDILNCFNDIFNIGLLFLPNIMCKEIGIITKIANGVNLLSAKKAISESVNGIVDVFKRKQYMDYITRYEDMLIAHMLITYSAFFDTIKEYLPDEYNAISLSPEEKYSISSETIQKYEEELKERANNATHQWLNNEIIIPNPAGGLKKFLGELRDFYDILTDEFMKFYEMLFAWENLEEFKRERVFSIIRELPDRAVLNYQKQYFELGRCFNDFFVWTNQWEHLGLEDKLDVGFNKIGNYITTFEEQCRDQRVVEALNSYAKRYENYIKSPAISSDEMDYNSEEDLVFPPKKNIFIPQQFKVMLYKKDIHLEEEKTWDCVKEQENIGIYVSSVLRHPSSNKTPLLILGQPGAGKSLLCHMLAAQILMHEYHVIIVKLRDVIADNTIIAQIEQQIERDMGKVCNWHDITRAKLDKPCLIIFDGYDELLQASGRTYSNYINRISEFQENELIIGRNPVKCLITSRVTLIDKAYIPNQSVVIKLCDFDWPRVEAWIKVWDEVNKYYFKGHNLHPFTLNKDSKAAELARQPLLLLMLAMYDSSNNILERQNDLSATKLYDSLIREFVSREKRKDEYFKEKDEKSQSLIVDEEIKKIGIAAIGMYNRKVLYIGAQELNSDIQFYYNSLENNLKNKKHDAELSEGEALLGSFFFIHKSNSTDAAGGNKINKVAYEFLHNTFGEFLTANFILSNVHETIDEILFRINNGRCVGWKDTLTKNWYASLIYAPLFSRPVVVKMLNEWSKEFFYSKGKNNEDIAKSLEQILEHEISLILKGDTLDSIKSVIEEKENAYEHETVITHLAIYSINLFILCALLIPDQYCFNFNELTNIDGLNKLICIWKYAFQEEDLGSLADFLYINRDESGITVRYIPDFKRGDSSNNKLKNLYRISTSIGDKLIQSLTGVLLGDECEHDIIEDALADSSFMLLSQYQFNVLLNKFDAFFHRNGIEEIGLQKLDSFRKSCFDDCNLKYVFMYYLLLDFLVDNQAIWPNIREKKNFVSYQVFEGLKLIKNEGQKALINKKTENMYFSLVEMLLIKMLLNNNINNINDINDIDEKELVLDYLYKRYNKKYNFAYEPIDLELIKYYNQMLKCLIKKHMSNYQHDILEYTLRNIMYIISDYNKFDFGKKTSLKIAKEYLKVILEISWRLIELDEVMLGLEGFRRYYGLKSKLGDIISYKYSIEEQSIIINICANLINSRIYQHNKETLSPEIKHSFIDVIDSISIHRLFGHSIEATYNLFVIINKTNLLDAIVSDKFIHQTLELVKTRVEYLPINLAVELQKFSRQYHCEEIEMILKKYVVC